MAEEGGGKEEDDEEEAVRKQSRSDGTAFSPLLQQVSDY